MLLKFCSYLFFTFHFLTCFQSAKVPRIRDLKLYKSRNVVYISPICVFSVYKKSKKEYLCRKKIHYGQNKNIQFD
jgi:hypothetical protein